MEAVVEERVLFTRFQLEFIEKGCADDAAKGLMPLAAAGEKVK